MRSLLRDPALQEILDRDGFFTQRPFLSTSDVSTLRQVYSELNHDFECEGFHATCYSADPDYRAAVLSAVREVVDPHVERMVSECDLVSADYVVKEGGGGEMGMHQDWSRVDERVSRSLVVWIPLEDTDEKNGRLSVLRESHVNIVAWRGENARDVPHFFSQFEQHISESVKEEYEVSLNVRAGEAVFYDARLIHFSPPNYTDHTRIAVNVSLVPSEARLVHSYRSSESTVDLIEVDPAFFTSHSMNEVPKGRKIDEVPYRFEILYPESDSPSGAKGEG